MKNIKKGRLIGLLACVVVAAVIALGYMVWDGIEMKMPETPSEGLEYTLNEDGLGYTVTGMGKCRDEFLLIPATHKGLPVTTIGEKAFQDVDTIKGVAIEEGVEKVETCAFHMCTSLKKIVLPDSLTYIGTSAFLSTKFYNKNENKAVIYIDNHAISGRNAKGDVVIKDGTISIAENFFGGISAPNDKVRSVTVPDSVTHVGTSAFSDSGIESATLGKGLKDVSVSLFARCTKLKSVTMSTSIKRIGPMAFSGCSALTNITLHDGIIEIWEDAFSGCSSLSEVTVPESVVYLGAGAFWNCASLSKVTLPDTIYKMGASVFSGTPLSRDENNWKNGVLYIGKYLMRVDPDWELTTVFVEEGTIAIAGGAMAETGYTNTSFLETVTLPDSLIGIGDGAFADCANLIVVEMPDDLKYLGESAFAGSYNLRVISIPEGVTTIRKSTFSQCQSLMSVSIPDGVTNIENSAFYDCAMETVTLPASVQRIDATAFNAQYGRRWYPDTIYYGGSQESWNQIAAQLEENALEKTTVVCGS